LDGRLKSGLSGMVKIFGEIWHIAQA